MKIFKFVLLLIIVSCSKEDKLEYDKSISYKNGVTMAPIFFERNGTTTNVKVSNGTDLFYESFNYEFIDSIVFKQVSSSYAKVGYSNSESMAMANYDILMYYKSNVVYKIENYLSEYKDDPIYTYYPNSDNDMFQDMNNNTKVEYKQTINKKQFYSSYIGKEIDVFEFEIHSFKNNKCNSINNEYLHPVRVDDWTFTLLENHK